MFNFSHNNRMGIPPVNQGQSPNSGGLTTVGYVPTRRPVDSRTNHQIWDSALTLEAGEKYQLAFLEFTILATRGVTEAKFKLGEYCYSGLGQPQSFSRAYLAFKRAAEDGHEEAQRRVAELDANPDLKTLS